MKHRDFLKAMLAAPAVGVALPFRKEHEVYGSNVGAGTTDQGPEFDEDNLVKTINEWERKEDENRAINKWLRDCEEHLRKAISKKAGYPVEVHLSLRQSFKCYSKSPSACAIEDIRAVSRNEVEE